MSIQVTWLPIVDDEDASQLIAESDEPFGITIKSEAGEQHIQSQHDGLVHFVSVSQSLSGLFSIPLFLQTHNSTSEDSEVSL